MNTLKLLLLSLLVSLSFNIKGQDFENTKPFKELTFDKDIIIKHKIFKIKVSNKCHSFRYNFHSNKYQCEDDTNIHYYYFNNWGLLDSFFTKNNEGDTLSVKSYIYNEKLQLVKTSTITGHHQTYKEEFYSYDDSNRLKSKWSLIKKDSLNTVNDTTRYIWKKDTCISINYLGGSPYLKNCNYIKDDKGNEIEYGRYNWEKERALDVSQKRIYKNQRLVRSILFGNTDFNDDDIENYFFYETDKFNRIIKKIEQLDSGKAFYTTKYIYKGDRITQLIYKNEMSDESYISTFEYFKN